MEYIGNVIYDKAVLEGDIKLVIYGIGTMGRRVFAFLENTDRLDKLDCICDADKELWGTLYKGVPVISPDEAVIEKRDCHFLTTGKYAKEQMSFLQRNGIKKIHIFLEV
jgi:FlaA1/EpsC-like NDP-sugar epimerase